MGRNKGVCILGAWKQYMVAAWPVNPVRGLPWQPSLIKRTANTRYCSPNGGICPWQLSVLCVLICSGQATYHDLFWLAWGSNITRTDAASCSATRTCLGSVQSSLSLFDLRQVSPGSGTSSSSLTEVKQMGMMEERRFSRLCRFVKYGWLSNSFPLTWTFPKVHSDFLFLFSNVPYLMWMYYIQQYQ